MPASRRQHGFTLVELLVVISIVTVLVALLLPSLASARKIAKRSLCLNNQRQLLLTELVYANDYSEWFMWVDANTDALLTGRSTNDPADASTWGYNGPIPYYISSGNIRICPSCDPMIMNPATIGGNYYRSDNIYGGMTYRMGIGVGSYLGAFPIEYGTPDTTWYGFIVSSFSQIPVPPCARLSFAGTAVSCGWGNVTYWNKLAVPSPSSMGAIVDLYNPTEDSQSLDIYYAYSIYPSANHLGERGENATFLDGHGAWVNTTAAKMRMDLFYKSPGQPAGDVWW